MLDSVFSNPGKRGETIGKALLSMGVGTVWTLVLLGLGLAVKPLETICDILLWPGIALALLLGTIMHVGAHDLQFLRLIGLFTVLGNATLYGGAVFVVISIAKRWRRLPISDGKP